MTRASFVPGFQDDDQRRFWDDDDDDVVRAAIYDEDGRCEACGAEADHHLGCPDDPDPDYEAEAELHRSPRRVRWLRHTGRRCKPRPSRLRFLAWPWRVLVWGLAGASDPWARRNVPLGREYADVFGAPEPDGSDAFPPDGCTCDPPSHSGHYSYCPLAALLVDGCCIRCQRLDPEDPCQGCYCHEDYPDVPAPGAGAGKAANPPGAGHPVIRTVPVDGVHLPLDGTAYNHDPPRPAPGGSPTDAGPAPALFSGGHGPGQPLTVWDYQPAPLGFWKPRPDDTVIEAPPRICAGRAAAVLAGAW